MSLHTLSAARKREFEDEAGPHGMRLAESAAEPVHAALAGTAGEVLL